MRWVKTFYYPQADLLSIYSEAIGVKKYYHALFRIKINFGFRYIDGAYLSPTKDREKVKDLIRTDPLKRVAFCNKVLEKNSEEFLRFCKNRLINPERDINANLLKKFTIFYEWFIKNNATWFMPLLIEEVLTELLQKYLQTIINPKTNSIKFNESLSALFLPVKNTEMLKEKRAILKIAAKPSEDRFIQHHQKYAYMGMLLLSGEPWTLDDIKKRVKRIKNPHKELRELQKTGKREKALLSAVQRKIKNPQFKILVRLVRKFAFIRTYHLEKTNEACYYALPFLKEVAKRMGLSYRELIYLTPKEIEAFLKRKIKPNRKQIKDRQKGYALINKPKVKIFTGQDIQKLKEKHQPKPCKTEKITGQCANKGLARGMVKIIKSISDISKVNIGDILVAEVTTPDFIPAMERAAAFVTNLGGITSHAAIIARELNKPCIIDTKIATKVLKDGDLVEVDAEKGIVKKL